MVNKKAYLKTVEAVIAIVIILSVVYVALPKQMPSTSSTPSVVKSSQEAILKEIAMDNELKACVIDDECIEASERVGQVIEENKPIAFDYAFRICNNPALCMCPKTEFECKIASPKGEIPGDANVYMSDVFLSSTISGKTHKLVRFWIWNQGS